MKIQYFALIILLTSFGVLAHISSEFLDGDILKEEGNLTFEGIENKTLKLVVDKDANFTGAFINFRGYNKNEVDGEKDEEASYDCIGSWCSTSAVDEDFGTANLVPGSGNNVTYYENISLVEYEIAALNWTSKASYYFVDTPDTACESYPHCTSYTEIYYWNYTAQDWSFLMYSNGKIVLENGNEGTPTVEKAIPSDGINNSDGKLRMKTIQKANFYQNQYYEGKVSFRRGNSSPTSPKTYINNNIIWNYTGDFLSFEKTNDFSSILNNAINSGLCDCSGCNLSDNNCSINLTLQSESEGILEYSNINISWLEYESPKVLIVQPTGEKDSTAIQYRLNSSDDWQSEICKYWVTRGASLEVANTTVSCSENITGITYVSSVGTNYTFHFYSVDSSGNANYTSENFSTSSGAVYVEPPSAGGGGGGGSSFDEIIEALTEPTTAPLCQNTWPKLKQTWRELSRNITIETIKNIWFAFWDYSLCQSSASIVPLEIQVESNFTKNK